MRRIESVRVPNVTRRMLRERLQRFLPANPLSGNYTPLPVIPTICDKEVVDLFLSIDIVPGDDVARAREVFENQSTDQSVPKNSEPGPHSAGAGDRSVLHGALVTSEQLPAAQGSRTRLTSNTDGNATDALVHAAHESNAGAHVHEESSQSTCVADSAILDELAQAKSFDELVQRGWIRTSWGRFSIPRDIVQKYRQLAPDADSPFKRLIDVRYKDEMVVNEEFGANSALLPLARRVARGEIQPGDITCVSRPWVAARLWDCSLDASASRGTSSNDVHLGTWVDRWRLLKSPSFAMGDQLGQDSLKEFFDAALAVLSAESTTPGWHEFRAAAIGPISLLYPHRMASENGVVSALPVATVARVRWMSEITLEHTFHEYMDCRASGLLTVLLNEIEIAEWDPLGLSGRLIELVVGRPVLLQQLVLRARRSPALLGDMLMSPKTSALACTLITNWEYNNGGWNREFEAHANRTTELFAFEDGIAMLGGHIDAGLVPVSELSALYLKIYELASTSRQSSRWQPFLSVLRIEVASADPEIHASIVDEIIAAASASSSPMVDFCAALDLSAEGECSGRMAPSDIVSLYLDVLLPRGERVGLRLLEQKSAQILVEMALRCDAVLRSRFLRAVDVPMWLQSKPNAENEQHAFHDLLVRRIRLHIRTLSRAITSWPTAVPEELVHALANAISAGATERPERGSVDAFATGLTFGHDWVVQELPVGFDLAGVLRRLDGNQRQSILTKLCLIEEPIVLAGIVANTPASMHEQIKARLLELRPENSSVVYNLPALQARVEALLNANLPNLAEMFISAERDAAPWGAVPGREIAVLRSILRLFILREDWASLASYTLADYKSEAIKREAGDVLRFHRGVAELKKPDGNPQAAEALFRDLARTHPGVTSYLLNLFASRVQRLLGNDAFALLTGDDRAQATGYLAEVEQTSRQLVQHSSLDLRVLETNRAMLLLAVGRPQESNQILWELRETGPDERVEALRALTLARLGSKREALALLTETEAIFGRTEMLTAVRENIHGHRSYVARPSLSIDDDPVPGIRQAFAVFRGLGHEGQAQVLQEQGRLDLFLIEEVRGACASVVAVAPMMKQLGMTRLEDDISGILKQILLSRLLTPQWSVGDQPRGGHSRTGGVGERDLLISKGAATLAIIEALVVDSVNTTTLTSHFTKLLSYDTCRFFFHITYARNSNCAGILAHLRAAAMTPPTGVRHVRNEELPDFDSMPIGFIGHFEIDSRPIMVVFLVLEIGQALQRAIAASQ